MSNEHCLVFARATGLFPDPAQQFFLLCLFFAALCYGCIAFASAPRPHKCCLFSLLYHRCGPQSLFAFAGRLRTISHRHGRRQINSKICGK